MVRCIFEMEFKHEKNTNKTKQKNKTKKSKWFIMPVISDYDGDINLVMRY